MLDDSMLTLSNLGAVRSLYAIKEVFIDLENVHASWDPYYLSPCTFAFMEYDANQSVSGLYVPPLPDLIRVLEQKMFL